MTAEQVIAALRAHHERMEGTWTLLEEALAIDVLAFHLGHEPPWPPHRRIAYEVKVSRQDFKAELTHWPNKAARAIRHSHALYFVVPEGLLYEYEMQRSALESELCVPEPAGLLEVTGSGEVKATALGPVIRASAGPLTDYETALLLHQAWEAGRAHG